MGKGLMNGYSQLEVAKIMGEPKDPRRPVTDLIAKVCEVDFADPLDYVYFFDVLLETEKIYIVTSSGEITQENVTPDTPALLSFIDVQSPEYFVKLIDLAKAKESVLTRKLKTINRALNAEENYMVINLIDGAIQSGKSITLRSGQTKFVYPDLIDMIDLIEDYGSNFVLICGATVAKDIKLWDYDENKYHSLHDALVDLAVEIIRIPTTHKVTRDDVVTQIIAANVAYLVALDTEVGKPITFVRKRLGDIDLLGTAIKSLGDKAERWIFASSQPVTHVSAGKRYLAVGLVGIEEVVIAASNAYAFAKFTRT